MTPHRMTVAVDPGNVRSAVVVLNHLGMPLLGLLEPNDAVLRFLRSPCVDTSVAPVLVIEKVESFGMAVGETVFDTVRWAGRFEQVAIDDGKAVERIGRRDVKLHLCGLARAKDSNIRQALIDRFGPGKDVAIGTKASMGPLYGLKADLWAALAVGLTYYDRGRHADPS